MTTTPEFDPHIPKTDAPRDEEQSGPEEKDEIPSFEGMVFSPYLDSADLTGSSWEQAEQNPEMPKTVWEEPPLSEEEILKVIASSGQDPASAQVLDKEAEEPAQPATNQAQAPGITEEEPAPLGPLFTNAALQGLYGNLADAAWVNTEKRQPKSGSKPTKGSGKKDRAEPIRVDDQVIKNLSPVNQDSIIPEDQGLIASEDQGLTVDSFLSAESSETFQARWEELRSGSRSAEAESVHQEDANQFNEVPELSSTLLLTTEAENRPNILVADEPVVGQRPLFQSWYVPQPKPVVESRIPHFGHLLILLALAFLGFVGAILLMRGALYYHLFGVSTIQQAGGDIHYTIGFMASLYLISFGASALVFPLIWHKGFFAGLQWNAASAMRHIRLLLGAAFVCFLLALVDEIVLPGPTNAPIDKLFDSRTAAWLLFAFGVTFAPFFEEIAFRGFLLPTLCTAFDWYGEKLSGDHAPPLGPGDYPHWSLPAMVLASITTSIPFALMHAEQTAWSLGPFLLLVAVSLVLCWARLAARSLAASVLVHACYNLLLFSLMLLGTGGFRHLDKM
jgi:hypothetical protein